MSSKFSRGIKGELKTTISGRMSKDMSLESYQREFFEITGDDGSAALNAFIQLNEGTQVSNKKKLARSESNAVISNLRAKYPHLSWRMLMAVFKIGTGRLKNHVVCKKAYTELHDSHYRNCNHLTEEDVKIFEDYMRSLKVEASYPCKHRRQKM
jgi:hypothetical protein